MPRVTYVGPFARGHVLLPTRAVPYVRGEAVEVTDDEAALLGDEWTATKSKPTKPKADEAATKEP